MRDVTGVTLNDLEQSLRPCHVVSNGITICSFTRTINYSNFEQNTFHETIYYMHDVKYNAEFKLFQQLRSLRYGLTDKYYLTTRS